MVCFVLQAGWSVSVDLVIGPDVGISYLTEKASSVSNAAVFKYWCLPIISIAMSDIGSSHNTFCIMNLRTYDNLISNIEFYPGATVSF